MNATSEKVRAELQAETGVDFKRYADDDLIDAVSGWSGLMGLAKDFGTSLAAAALVLAVAVGSALVGRWPVEIRIGVIVGGVLAAVGVLAVMFAFRARKRAPTEAAKIFELTSSMVDRVAEDVATGRLTVTPTEAARGLALVAAAPALTRVAQRRFPLVGMVAAPAVGALLTRVLARVWPQTGGGSAMLGLEGTARRLNEAVSSAEAAVLPKLATGVRWATIPLLLGGFLIGGLGVVIALASIATA